MSQGRMTFSQVLQQSKDFQTAADEVARFHLNNFQTLKPDEERDLNDAELQLRDQARQLLHDATAIVWNDLQDALDHIRNATDKMRSVRSHLRSVSRTIQFATAGLILAGSILSGDPLAVAASSLKLVDLVNKFRKEDDDEEKAEEDAVGE